MPHYPLVPDRSCLLLFDLVNDFVGPDAARPIPGTDALIARLAGLVAAARQHSLAVAYVKPRGYAPDYSDFGQLSAIYPDRKQTRILVQGTPGVEVHADLAPLPGDLVVQKQGYSAFLGTELEGRLRERGIDTLVIGGVVSNIGCDTVAREAFIRQFKVIYLSDGTLARPLTGPDGRTVTAEEIQRVVLATMAYAFGRVAAVAEVVAELTQLSYE